MGANGSYQHGVGVYGGLEDECDTDSVEVWYPVAFRFGDSVTNDDGCDGEHTQYPSGYGGGGGNCGTGFGDGGGNGGPGTYGRHFEGTTCFFTGCGFNFGGSFVGHGNTVVCSAVQEEETDRKEDGDEGTKDLCDELAFRCSTEDMTCFKITDHINGLGCCCSGDGTTDQVQFLGLEELGSFGHTLTFGYTTENELGGFGDGGDGVNVGLTRGLEPDECEEEGEDNGEDAFADTNVEGGFQDDDGENGRHDDTANPHPCGDVLVGESRVFVVLLGCGERSVAFSFNGGDKVLDTAFETIVDHSPVPSQFGEGGADHHHDTGPEHPVTGGGSIHRVFVLWVTVHGRHVDFVFLGMVCGGETDGLAAHYHPRAEQSPSQEGSQPHRSGNVETAEHTSTNESRGPFQNPGPVLGLNCGFVSPGVEPVEDVPVAENPGGEELEDGEGDGTKETV